VEYLCRQAGQAVFKVGMKPPVILQPSNVFKLFFDVFSYSLMFLTITQSIKYQTHKWKKGPLNSTIWPIL